LAGLAVGFWKDQEELQKLWQPDKTFSPAMEDSKREKLVHFWHKAVERTKNWEE
jgi:glycerol kinase